MKIYFKVFLIMIAGLLVSCTRRGFYGPQGSDGWGHMMYYVFGYGGIFMCLIFFIVIGLLVYFIVQSQKTKGQTPTENESHLDILKKRYAKGEITKEQFETMKEDLK